jgi:hypothetical protein
VNSFTTDRFWKCYGDLPQDIRAQAKEAYRVFLADPYYPSLHFKRIHASRPVFSVRISIDYRAIGIMDGDSIVWSWIGSHAEYDRIAHGR